MFCILCAPERPVVVAGIEKCAFLLEFCVKRPAVQRNNKECQPTEVTLTMKLNQTPTERLPTVKL